MLVWKKASEDLPVDTEDVIIRSKKEFYVATYSKNEKAFIVSKLNAKLPLAEVEFWAKLEKP